MKNIQVPGSKSITNRVLILSALSPNKTILTGVLHSDDTKHCINTLRNFGVNITATNKETLEIIPPQILKGNNSKNYIGNSGTTSRFIVACTPHIQGEFSLYGITRMHERPFVDLFETINSLGGEINFLEKKNFLPASFISSLNYNKKRPIISISGKISSQFLTGLLLSAPKFPHGLEINLIDNIPSLPYVEMTISILRIWQVHVDISNDFTKFIISSGLRSPNTYHIPADSSSASYPIIYSILNQKPLTITNFGTKTLQGDEQFIQIAINSGVNIYKQNNKLIIQPTKKLELPEILDFTTMPDVSMSGMILSLYQNQKTKFIGLESLRVKECDRITAMVNGIKKLGFKVDTQKDDIIIYGDILQYQKLTTQDLSMVQIDSFDDHRIAMVFGVLRTITKSNFQITKPECVSKTWPNFWLELADWNSELRTVASIIVRQKFSNNIIKYLIVKKPRKNNAWQFPQGGQDANETLKQTGQRELTEECGDDLIVKFHGEKPIGSYKYFFPNDFHRHQQNINGANVNFFLADFISGTIKLDNNELCEYKWIEKEKFSNFFSDNYLKEIKNIII